MNYDPAENNIGETLRIEVFALNEAIVVFSRSLIAFFTLLIFARFLGKQQISQLTFFDYVLGITIGSIAASLSIDLESRAWPHWVGLATWTLTVFLIQYISVKSPVAAKLFVGEPVVVISNGKILEEAMGRLRYTTTDLMEELREKDVFDYSQVQFAVVESNGELSVLLKPEYQQPTIQDLNLTVPNSSMSAQLIYDGMIIRENLDAAGVDENWLIKQLKQQNIKHVSDVFLASYNSGSGTLYLDRYEDGIDTSSKQL